MIIQQLSRWAQEQPGKTALQVRHAGGVEGISFAELWARIAAGATRLRAAEVAPGDRVALFAAGGPEWAVAYLAAHAAGAAVVPIDAQYGATELRTLLEFSSPRIIIADAACREKATRAAEGTDIALWDLAAAAAPAPAPPPDFTPHAHREDDTMSIIFTSGTTGSPKGVVLTCGNLHANIEGLLVGIRITAGDNFLNILPLHHAYASTVGLLAPLFTGATVTFSPSLKGPDLVAAMQETEVTLMPGVPQLFLLFHRAIFQAVDALGLAPRLAFWCLYAIARLVRRTTGLRLGKLFFRKIHRRFGPRLRCFASGGAKLDPRVCEQFLDLGILMLEGYGLTETSPVIAFTPIDKPRPGSVGRPLHNVEVRIDAPGPDGIGEICVRGPSVMKGYYRNAAATAEVIRDGWLHTGDLGCLDREGMLRITGRAKDVIVLSSGKNIYPEDVEKLYENTLMVREICVLPRELPDGTVQGLTAVVVPDAELLAARKVANPYERIKDELAKTAGTLPSYMRISDLVLYTGELPRTRLGKLRRTLIAEEVAHKARRKDAAAVEMPEDHRALMAHPAAARFLARLAEVTGAAGPFHPGQDLEIDLGIDSLTQVEITVLLETEFGVKIPEEEIPATRTIGDILARVTAAAGEDAFGGEAEATRRSWRERLAEPVAPPLEARFNMQPGPVKRLTVRVMSLLLRVLCLAVFRARLRGKEKLPRDGPYLLCPNHQSYVDPVLIYALMPARDVLRMLFVAFGEIFRRAPLSWLVGFTRLILTGGADTLVASLQLSHAGLRCGQIVCIFPEGGRTTTGEVMAPRPGAGILAVEARVPIVPVRIDGALATLSIFHPRFRPCKIAVTVGDPILPADRDDDHPAAAYQAMTAAWHEAILRMDPARQAREDAA